MDQFLPSLVVISLAALPLGVGTIKPNLVDRAIFGQQFKKLIQEIFVIVVHHKLKLTRILERTPRHFARNSALRVLAEVAIQTVRTLYLEQIGRRKINAQFQSVLLARAREVLEYIPLAIPKPGRHDAVVGITALPQDKAIVVLGRKDDHLHARSLHGTTPLVGIQGFQGKDLRRFHARPPLLAGECIGPEMDKGNKFILQGSQLVGRGYNVGGLLHHHLTRVVFHTKGVRIGQGRCAISLGAALPLRHRSSSHKGGQTGDP